jgi:hypothetical protein
LYELFQNAADAPGVTEIDIKLDDADKVEYVKEAKAFMLQDVAKKHGYTVTFAD